jgi:hypothetical protein
MRSTVNSRSGILGHLVSDSDRVELSLFPRELFKMKGDKRGLQILCRRGKLWVTQASDEMDYMLEAGQRFVVSRPGVVLVQSLGEGLMQVASPGPS